MRYYHPRMLEKYQVFEDGTVVLPQDKQSALYMLALEVGKWAEPVTDVKSYETAIRDIFTDKQLLIIDYKLWEYHAIGFTLMESENLTPLFFEAGMSTWQDLAWFDFTLLMCDYEKRVRPHYL